MAENATALDFGGFDDGGLISAAPRADGFHAHMRVSLAFHGFILRRVS